MVGTIERSHKFALDTCIGRRCYENPAYLDMLKTRVNFDKMDTVFTSVSVFEVDKRAEYGFNEMQSAIESSLGKKIDVKEISYDMNLLGMWLRDNIGELHFPDDRILAYAMITGSILITCDKGLEKAARSVGHAVINPDNAVIDFSKTKSDLARLAKSKMQSIRKKIVSPVQGVQKAKSLALKPGKKIIWRSFE